MIEKTESVSVDEARSIWVLWSLAVGALGALLGVVGIILLLVGLSVLGWILAGFLLVLVSLVLAVLSLRERLG